MTNSLTKIFDTIGFSFRTKNNFFIPIEPIKGYNSLNSSHIGYYIPYLVRNYASDNTLEYEVGVGYIVLDGTDIVVDRYKVVKSSNNDQKVNFKPSTKSEFYIFANESNFNTGFNNVIVKTSSFTADAVQAVYLVDTSESTMDIILPSGDKSDNLVLEFKLIAGENPAIVRDSYGSIILSLRKSNKYTKLAYHNKTWHQLKEEQQATFSAESLDKESFTSQADAAGDIYSFQYNQNGSALAGSTMYWGSGNTNKLLLGSSSEALAHTIIPTSGSGPVVFNNDRTNSDFIVHGSGDRNLFVTYDGRLGLNIPSGSRPQTVFHVVNHVCQEGFRLENRSACHPANITLYHKPSGDLTSNTIVAEINLAGKNSDNNKVDYSKIISRAKDPISASQKGKLEIVVESAGSEISTIKTDPDATIIGYGNNNLVVSGNNNTSLGFPNTNLNLTSTTATLKGNTINLQSQNIVFGSGNAGTITLPSLVASNIEATNLRLPSILPNSILALDSAGNVSAGTSVVRFPTIPSGRVLTTDVGGSVTGVFYTDSFFLSDRDFSWNKFPKRSGSVCLRQVVLTTPATLEEFFVGDQIAVVDSNNRVYYRTVNSLDIANNAIVGILVDQNLTESATNNVTIHSITRGGYLSLEMYTEPGTIADATSIVLSLRPNVSTVFNEQHRDIDFLVYGTDPVPSLSIRANSGRSYVQSGEYLNYATQQDAPLFPIPVTASGQGTSNSNNTANYRNTASGIFSGMVTSVRTNGLPSYYGTYDQNGNVAEWLEDSNRVSTSSSQYAAGGSWASLSNNALHSVIPYSISGGYQDIGFRVCSSYGLLDNSYIANSLSLSFVSVTHPNNGADPSPVYTSNGLAPLASGVPGLGVVDKNYRIGVTETTNSQYVKFLNAVAATDNFDLYDSNMSGSLIGGIGRSGTAGSYSYYTKALMDDKPVVFVDYLSSIRFTNWLHNNAPTGIGLSSSITEDGAYTLFNLGSNTYQITKNTYQKYWLPSLNEWHKAAYFVPSGVSANSGTSSVLIKRNSPYLVASGTDASGVPYIDYASLSVSGWIYADKLKLGDGSFSSSLDANNSRSLSLLNGTMVIESGSHKVTIGAANNVVIDNAGSVWNGTYGNVLSNTGIVLSANGDIVLAATGEVKIYSSRPIKMSGLIIDEIKYQTLTKVDTNGAPASLYGGTISGLLFKENNTTATANNQMIMVNSKVTMPSETINSPLFINPSNEIATYSGITYIPSGEVTITSPLVVNSIQIGEELEFYRGSILTHNGIGPASWEPAEYLKAEGILWNRYIKRPVLVYPDKMVFTSNPGLDILAKEFSYSDTIAVINKDSREIKYVKAADSSTNIIDGPSPIPVPTAIFNAGAEGTELTFCPSINWSTNDCSGVSGFAYSVTKGGYLSIQIEQDNNSQIQSSFSCSPNSTGYYKPNTLNTISTRPNKPTAFNLLGEDIDFAIYGAKYTPYHSYDNNIFATGADGLPVGLIPAFKINANTSNAVYGDASSGVYFSGYTNVQGTLPSGYLVDERAKVSINTNNAYLISSIPSGTGTLGVYADLSVNGYTYSSGIITNEVYIRPLPDIGGNSKYIINAPLTVNEYGQIISQVPQTAPTVPGSPTSVEGVEGNSSATLSWAAPTNNGGRVVINYLVEFSLNGGSTWTTYSKPASTATNLSVTGLQNNIEYLFKISAINSVGTGSPSNISSGITPRSNRPSQPRSLSVTRGALSATLTWTIPVYGSPTNYVVEYSDDNGETWSTYPDPDTVSTGTTVTIPGLLDTLRYLFRVKAQNSNGYGTYAEVASLGTDPYVPPTDPTEDSTSLWDFGKITFTGVCV